MKAKEKFETCKFRSGTFCLKQRLLGIPHNVGINGYSIESHCKKCKKYRCK